MKRYIFRILICSLFGACVNVFIAMSLAIVFPVDYEFLVESGGEKTSDCIHRIDIYDSFGVTAVIYRHGMSDIAEITERLQLPSLIDSMKVALPDGVCLDDEKLEVALSSGWPYRSMRCKTVRIHSSVNANTNHQLQHLWQYRIKRKEELWYFTPVDDIIIPLQPITFGFIINTLFYGLLSLFILTLKRAIHKRITLPGRTFFVWLFVICFVLGCFTAFTLAAILPAIFPPAKSSHYYGIVAVNSKESTYLCSLTIHNRLGLSRALLRMPDESNDNSIEAPKWINQVLHNIGQITEDECIVVEGSGFPFISNTMTATIPVKFAFETDSMKYDQSNIQFSGAIPLKHWDGPSWVMYLEIRSLVINLYFPGYCINAVVWSIAWLLTSILIIGPGYCWRPVRARSGKCVICGYDLRGDFESGCPECGWNRTETEKREVEQ